MYYTLHTYMPHTCGWAHMCIMQNKFGNNRLQKNCGIIAHQQSHKHATYLFFIPPLITPLLHIQKTYNS